METWNEQLDAIARGFDESKEEINLRLQGLSTEQLLAGTDELVKKFVKQPKAEAEVPPKPKGKGPVLKRKTVKEFRQD